MKKLQLLGIVLPLIGCSAEVQSSHEEDMGEASASLVGDRKVSAVSLAVGALVNGSTAPTDQYYEGTFRLPSYQGLVTFKGRSEYDSQYNVPFTPSPTEFTGIVVRIQSLQPPLYYFPGSDPGAAGYTISEVSAEPIGTTGNYKWRFRGKNPYVCSSNCTPPKIGFHVWGVVNGVVQAAGGSTVQAEASTSDAGTSLANGGTAVHFNVSGSRCYNGVDLTGVTGIETRYASLAGNDVSLWADGTPQNGGIQIGDFIVNPTGGFGTFQTFKTNFSSSGVRTLCLVGASEGQTGAGVLNLDSFKLVNTKVSSCQNNVLPRVAATASSTQGATWAASRAIDDSQTTRWSSAFSDPQWLSVDFGAKSHLSEVWLKWETAYSSDFTLQVSDDNSHWGPVLFEGSGFTGAYQRIQLNAAGRYLRVYSKTRATGYGVSLFDVAVLGDSNAACQ